MTVDAGEILDKLKIMKGGTPVLACLYGNMQHQKSFHYLMLSVHYHM